MNHRPAPRTTTRRMPSAIIWRSPLFLLSFPSSASLASIRRRKGLQPLSRLLAYHILPAATATATAASAGGTTSGTSSRETRG
jgi:hypothetical protein